MKLISYGDESINVLTITVQLLDGSEIEVILTEDDDHLGGVDVRLEER